MSSTTTTKHTHFEGYWCESPYNAFSSLPYTTYPESQHPTHTFSFPKPNHFTLFWSLPQNKDFILSLHKILIKAEKHKPSIQIVELIRNDSYLSGSDESNQDTYDEWIKVERPSTPLPLPLPL